MKNDLDIRQLQLARDPQRLSEAIQMTQVAALPYVVSRPANNGPWSYPHVLIPFWRRLKRSPCNWTPLPSWTVSPSRWYSINLVLWDGLPVPVLHESKCCAVPHTISWTSQHLGHRASEVVFLDLFTPDGTKITRSDLPAGIDYTVGSGVAYYRFEPAGASQLIGRVIESRTSVEHGEQHRDGN